VSPEVLRARHLVEARLGREPQDALEAAVVLEAWAGVPAQQALETARAMMPTRRGVPLVSRAKPAPVVRPPRQLAEGLAFVVTIAAIALWAAPLVSALGVQVVRDALVLALPSALAVQWALASRHLARPSGLAGLAPRRGALLATAALLVLGAGTAFGRTGALAGLLVVTWTAGTLLIRRGWGLVYCGLVTAAVAAMLLGLPAPSAVAVIATATAALAWAGLITIAPAQAVPGRWTRTCGAALTGAGVGVLLVADPTVSWTSGFAAALALVPSALGALWASRHLWKLAGAFPRALAGVPACAPRPARRALAGAAPRRDTRHSAALRAPARALAEAVCRLVGLTAVASATLLALTTWSGTAPTSVGVLAGYGVIALATLLAGVIDSLGRPALAAAGIAAGVAAALPARAIEPPFAGAGLLFAGAVAVSVLLPAAVLLLARPARTLATTVWIT